MASTSRTTRNSQKTAISDTLRSFAPASSQGMNQPTHQPSPQISKFSVGAAVAQGTGIIPTSEGSPTRTHSPIGSHHSHHSHQSHGSEDSHHSDQSHRSDAHTEQQERPDEEMPPREADLASAFKMLAQNISKISSEVLECGQAACTGHL